MSQKPKMSCTSDKFSTNFYTDSLLSWHGKLVIFRTCSVYVIYNKSHCPNSSLFQFLLISAYTVILFVDLLCSSLLH